MRTVAEAPAKVPKQPSQHERVQKILEKGTPEDLEAEVRSSRRFLMDLNTIFTGMVSVNRDAHHWVQQIGQIVLGFPGKKDANFQIDGLLSQKVDTPTIIGVVGNTGAGKSSVINAMLEEERLVPTNCMRACTAVVTEMSWNPSNDESEKYRAHIEFIEASDWEKDLRISLTELMDGNGQVCKC